MTHLATEQRITWVLQARMMLPKCLANPMTHNTRMQQPQSSTQLHIRSAPMVARVITRDRVSRAPCPHMPTFARHKVSSNTTKVPMPVATLPTTSLSTIRSQTAKVALAHDRVELRNRDPDSSIFSSGSECSFAERSLRLLARVCRNSPR